MRIVLLTMCFLAAGAAAEAQEHPLAHADLPRGVEARLTAVIENPGTRQITGADTIAEPHTGDVVVFNGPLLLNATIDGQLIVVDGNVLFEEGAAVTGDVTVVNGEALGLEHAVIAGTVTLYGEGFGWLRGGERVLAVNSRTRRVYREDDRRASGYSTFSIRTGWNYNRVEGLPIHFGPVIETSGSNATRVEAMAIWRTEVSGPFDTEDWGYALRGEQFVGGGRNFRVGATFKSVIQPIEDWQLTKSEASLATFVLHSDFRDYFQREGWSAYARFTPRATGLSATLEYSDEDHSSQPARDPWTIFSGDHVWRLQPVVAEGRFRNVNAALQWDGRNDDDFPTAGFLVRGELTRGLGGSLVLPPVFNPLADPLNPPQGVAFDEQFTRGLIDARVYRPVGRDGTLSFRLVGGGAIGQNSLPPQFQHALGGAGSLPGYGVFSADCGARLTSGTRGGSDVASYFASYGCDRVALFSAEYRGGFDLHFGGFNWRDEEDEDDWGWRVDANPNWIIFFDAARGWAQPESRARGAEDTPTLYDVGAGILLGDIGVYGAVPLTGSDRDMKFFVRLGPRF